ncbi:hypothetical protein VP01_6543g1, partial [Puccinia sorghi]
PGFLILPGEDSESTQSIILVTTIPAYNHYVHFLQKKTDMKGEKKKLASFMQMKNTSLLAEQGTEYQRIISDVKALSNNDTILPMGYITSKPSSSDPSSFAAWTQQFYNLMTDSIFPKPPKGLPLDFYDPNWFNNLLLQQRIDVADTRQVALLPDASQSLLGKQVPSKKFTDKQFNLKFFDQLSARYDLTHKIKSYDDNKEKDDEDNGSYGGKEIDLENMSGSGNEDTFDDVDQEDVDFVEEVMDGVERKTVS